MRKTFRIMYSNITGCSGLIETSGEELTEEQAHRRAEEYLKANGIPYMSIISVYEVNDNH